MYNFNSDLLHGLSGDDPSVQGHSHGLLVCQGPVGAPVGLPQPVVPGELDSVHQVGGGVGDGAQDVHTPVLKYNWHNDGLKTLLLLVVVVVLVHLKIFSPRQ